MRSKEVSSLARSPTRGSDRFEREKSSPEVALACSAVSVFSLEL